MDSYPPKEVLKDLIEGNLDWPRVKQIMSSPKDADRFEKYVAPVVGVFEIREDKISGWRDYFDMQTWTRQTS